MRNPPSPPHACRAYLLRSCMTRSTVISKPQPHASLGLPAYVQFTSPIRRCGCGGGSVGQWGWGVQKCGGCDRVEVCGGRGEEALPLHAKGWCQWLAFSAPHHIDWISNPDTITSPLTTHPSTYPPMYRYGDVLAHYQVRDRREVEGVGSGPPQSITTYLPGRSADLRPAHFTLPHFQVRAHLQGRPLPLTAGAIDAIMSAAQVRI